MAKVLKSCPKSNKSPNLVTLSVMASVQKFRLEFKFWNIAWRVDSEHVLKGCSNLCNQIKRFFKVLGKKFPIKRSPNDWQLFGLFWKTSLSCKNCINNFLGNFWKKVVLFTPTSGHTGSNASQMGDQYRKYTLKGQLGLLATTSPIYLLALKDDSHSTHVRICRFCKRPHQRRIGNCLSCLYPNESGEISLPWQSRVSRYIRAVDILVNDRDPANVNFTFTLIPSLI